LLRYISRDQFDRFDEKVLLQHLSWKWHYVHRIPSWPTSKHKWVKCKVARPLINLAQFFKDLSRSEGTATFILTYCSCYEGQLSVSRRELFILDKTALESDGCWLRLTACQDGERGRKISILIGNRH